MSHDAMQRAKALRAQGLTSFNQPAAAPIVQRKASSNGKFERTAHGATQIAKTLVRIGVVPPEILAARAERGCRPCEHAVFVGGVLVQCRICRCALPFKLRQANERCAMGDERYPKSAHLTPRWTQYISVSIHGLPA